MAETHTQNLGEFARKASAQRYGLPETATEAEIGKAAGEFAIRSAQQRKAGT